MLRDDKDNQSRFDKTTLDEAIYKYHYYGGRLYQILYYVIIIEAVVFVLATFIGCIVAFSSMAVLSRIIEAIWNAF